MRFADNSHYFDWCALTEKLWRQRVNANKKTWAVNEKLAVWHAKNPDGEVVNLAKWRIKRGQKAAGQRLREVGV